MQNTCPAAALYFMHAQHEHNEYHMHFKVFDIELEM